MKKSIVVLLTALSFLAGCGTARQAKKPAEIPILIRVECRNEESLKSFVLLILKRHRPDDILLKPSGAYMDIEATYNHIGRDQFYKMEEIEKTLSVYPGILYIEITKPYRFIPDRYGVITEQKLPG